MTTTGTPLLPRSRQIAADIVEEIRSGKLKPGAYIPSVRALAKRHVISTATASRVHEHVRASGLIKPVSGLGNVVVAPTESVTV